ncbi:lipoprotein [Pimelobacter sp. 30-1]|uniref:lipoprotein n=1 Tax=Pimelobacter sp. 30-1 TaxID=2004991 RepID=UPI001C05AFD2|nr:lipoprotein [Pimelobacter sp. 30-1]MBU2695331.1 hypothetical protein [Pimelobacter sp. 30-1]
MPRPRVARTSAVAAAVVLLAALVACSDDRDRGRGAPPDADPDLIGTASSACDLPVLVRVPERWAVEAMTPEMVARADDPRLTSPGGFALVCSLLGSPDGILAPVFLFVAPPEVARGRTAEQLLQRFVRAAYGEGKIDMREVTVGAGTGVEGTFTTSRATPSPVQRRAFVLPTPTGVVVVTNGGLDQESIDEGLADYASVRDSMDLPD